MERIGSALVIHQCEPMLASRGRTVNANADDAHSFMRNGDVMQRLRARTNVATISHRLAVV